MSAAPNVKLGFLPLCDAAPLIVASVRGYFEDEGLDVELVREVSWANLRDKLAVGALDGAHLLGPMVMAARLGLGGASFPARAVMALNRNGAAITVSRSVAARGLATIIQERLAERLPAPTLATVFPYSIHTYLMRAWLIGQGVDPDSDVRMVTAPPSRMMERLAAGEIDGFCAGAPWNAYAVAQKVGKIVATIADVWPDAPDKVLCVTDDFASERADDLQSLLRATIRGAAWANNSHHREELMSILSQDGFVGPSAKSPGALGGIVFPEGEAGAPQPAEALWLFEQMQSAEQLHEAIGADDIGAGFSPRPYLRALMSLKNGASAPQHR